MPSREDLEFRLLHQFSATMQACFAETRELSDDDLFVMVQDLEDENSFLFMVQATREEKPDDSVFITEDGREEIQ